MKDEKTVNKQNQQNQEAEEARNGRTIREMHRARARVDTTLDPAFAALGSWDTQPSRGKRLRKGR